MKKKLHMKDTGIREKAGRLFLIILACTLPLTFFGFYFLLKYSGFDSSVGYIIPAALLGYFASSIIAFIVQEIYKLTGIKKQNSRIFWAIMLITVLSAILFTVSVIIMLHKIAMNQ